MKVFFPYAYRLGQMLYTYAESKGEGEPMPGLINGFPKDILTEQAVSVWRFLA